jgi:hypothetical protein
MDVQLPDGTVVKGVPDGMSKDDLVAKLKASGRDVSWHKPSAGVVSEGMPKGRSWMDDAISAAEVGQTSGVTPTQSEKAFDFATDTAAAFPGSAANAVIGLGGAILHPLDTAAGIYDFGKSAGAAGVTALADRGYINATNPQGLEEARVAAKPFYEFAGRHVGMTDGVPNTLNTLRTDPAGWMLDASMLAGGAGGLARRGGMVGTADTLARAADVVNPMNYGPVQAVRGAFNQGANAYEGVRNMLNPRAQVANALTEGRGAEIINALRQKQEGTQGYAPTAGEVIAGMENAPAVLPAFQRLVLNKQLSSEANARVRENTAAQTRALETISGTEAEQAALLKAREAQAARDYGQVWTKEPVMGDAELAALKQRPTMKEAMSEGEYLAAEKGRPFQIGEDVAAVEAAPGKMTPTGMIDVAGQPILRELGTKVATEAEFAKYPTQSLHDIKIAMDNALERNATANGTVLTDKQRGLLMSNREKFIKWFEDKVPEYGVARTNYAEASKPINVQEVGQKLKETFVDPLTGESRPAAFANATTRNEALTLKKATGQKRFESLDEVLGPADMKKVASILDELQQEAKYKNLASAGATQAGSILGEVPDLPRSPSFLNAKAALFNKAISILEKRMNPKVAKEYATALMDPATAAGLLEMHLKKYGDIERGAASIRARGARTANALRNPAVAPLNALATYNDLAGR